MLFAKKSKGYFVDYTDNGVLIARTSSPTGAMEVEQLFEVAAGDDAELKNVLSRIEPKKSPSGYLHASVGVYPPKRLVRRATLEQRRIKEPGYLSELVSTQFRVDPEKHVLTVLNANDGSDFDPSRAAQKEVLCCGIDQDEVIAYQDRLLANSIYPERLELGTVASLGALVGLLGSSQSNVPTLVLEIGIESTHSFIVTSGGVEASRPIPQGLDAMIPVVQKELNLKDEESARKLFFSNTFDFTGMGPVLTKRLLKELHSSIGFYEVQTGQSVGQVVCLMLPPKLGWLETSIAAQLGVGVMKMDYLPWLQAQGISLPADHPAGAAYESRWLGLFGLMASHNASLAQKE